jgi:hypothetical protein
MVEMYHVGHIHISQPALNNPFIVQCTEQQLITEICSCPLLGIMDFVDCSLNANPLNRYQFADYTTNPLLLSKSAISVLAVSGPPTSGIICVSVFRVQFFIGSDYFFI